MKVKKPSVCKGCKYLVDKHTYSNFNQTCNYMEMTGHSRLKVELENGGFQVDSCVCYEKKTRKGRPKKTETQEITE